MKDSAGAGVAVMGATGVPVAVPVPVPGSGAGPHAGAAPGPTAAAPQDAPAPAATSPSGEFLARVPHEFARRHLILSQGVKEDEGAGADGEAGPCERLLVSEGTSSCAVFNVGVRLGRTVRTSTAEAEALAAAVDRAYLEAARGETAADGSRHGSAAEVPSVLVQGSGDVERDLDDAVREAEADLLSTQGKAPAVRLVDLILFEALLKGASDVHVQPLRDRTLVRYRLDGALHTARELPAALAAGVVSRIKVMSRLDVAEHRAAQDGRATVTVGGSAASSGGQAGRRVDLRISVLPSTYGERVVLRLLDPSRSPHLTSFAGLGMPPEVERRYLAQVSKTSGIVLSTGPTGSGKTTSLYATLAWVSHTNAGGSVRGCELNMMTVEDPVEYDLSGAGGAGLSVSQTQVDPKKGVTFAAGLRHILRQDPDVIMVGEVRDEETARIAVQASLTGHLVLSTLHTSDAASAVARLLDLGVEPFLVSSSLSAVLAQRLVRKVHAECRGAGCEGCLRTGYRGRTGVFELLVVDGRIRELVERRAGAVEIKEAARLHCGMVTLKEAGQALVDAGVTTPQEVARVIEALDGGAEGGEVIT